VVTSDGGSCVSDAVLETRRIVATATILRGEPAPARRPRFGFDYRGSVQGFAACPLVPTPYPTVLVGNTEGTGLRLSCAGVGPGVAAAVSTPVFLDPATTADNFSTVASPTLYCGQHVTVAAHSDRAVGPTLRLYVAHRGPDGEIHRTDSDAVPLSDSLTELSWVVPDIGSSPLLRLGLLIESPTRFDGTVTVAFIDWAGAPEHYHLDGILLTSIWDTRPEPLRAWVSSAANFEADFDRTFSISHPHGIGLATTGSTDWDDYTLTSQLCFSLHRQAGLVSRSVGHRRYYAAVFAGGSRLSLVKRYDAGTTVLASTEFPYQADTPYRVQLRSAGTRLEVSVDGEALLGADDGAYRSGAAGFLIDEGTLYADGFDIRRAQ
jgi:hypothetical protein